MCSASVIAAQTFSIGAAMVTVRLRVNPPLSTTEG